MTDESRDQRKDPKEGVRIIGAEEAAEALERDDVAKRRPESEKRFGDRPETPPEDGPRPAIRFPLSGAENASDVERPAVVPPPPPSRDVSMPHWTEPATGEVPKIFASDDDGNDDLEAWSSFSTSQPRWRGEGTARDADDFDDFSRLADDETRVGALDQSIRPDPDDFFSFDELDAGEPAPPESPRAISSDPRRSAARAGTAYERPAGTGRDMSAAVAVGAGLIALLLIMAAFGPRYVMVLVTAVIVVAAAEFFNAVRKAGHQPATLLGIVACGALALAAYWKGDAAIPLVLFLTVAFALLWYFIGAGGSDPPVAGVASTMLGVCYVGLLGSFAALILTLPDGVGILLATIIGTVGYDLGGFFIGRSTGTRALSEMSPNKTIEGLLGGMVVAVLVVVVIFGIFPGVAPLDSFDDALWFAIAIAVAAPIGDLCESMMKRDLGVKDMGDILPGHGGLLDRFDALLLTLPTAYYVARILLF